MITIIVIVIIYIYISEISTITYHSLFIICVPIYCRYRWRALMHSAERNGLVCIRMSAIDGQRVSTSEFTQGISIGSTNTNINSDGRSTSNSSSSSSSSSSNSTTQLIHSIPESDVALYWDSTLNNRFDSKCVLNKVTPMTQSERACAASHLKVWRTINKLRTQYFNKICCPSAECVNINDNILLNQNNGCNQDGYNANTNNANNNINNSTQASLSQTTMDVVSSNPPLVNDNINDHINININELNIAMEMFTECYLGGGWKLLSPSHNHHTHTSTHTHTHTSSSSQHTSIPSTSSHHSPSQESNMNLFFHSEWTIDSDWYLILEDDASFTHHINSSTSCLGSDFLEQINELLQHYIPDDFDICYLGHVCSKLGKLITINKYIAKPDYLWQLHGYILRGRAIPKLLSYLPIFAPVDNFISQLILDGVLKVIA